MNENTKHARELEYLTSQRYFRSMLKQAIDDEEAPEFERLVYKRLLKRLEKIYPVLTKRN